MIVLKGTLDQVQHDLAVINAIAAAWWAAQGYTVIDTPSGKAVVGKNAETGEDNPEALTTTWADPEQGEDGAWFIISPSSDARFSDWRAYIPPGVTIQCEEVSL